MSRSAPRRVRAVLLDALGTLIELQPPGPPLRAELRRRFGVQVTAHEAEQAIRAEIGYYRAHLDEGSSEAALVALRRRCAEALRDGLPGSFGARLADVDRLTAALLASLRFSPYADVRPALTSLRRAGVRLVVVSNWDVSLHAVLDRVGIGELVDGVVTSAEAGARKPAPGIFKLALGIAGVPAGEAIHVGDSPLEDVGGARGAGIEPVLVSRNRGSAPPGVRTIASLRELEA